MMYHALDICCEVAHRLKNPDVVNEIVQDRIRRHLFYSPHWSELSFAWGMPGIVAFYAMMHRRFEQEGWDKVAHAYLQTIKRSFESGAYFNTSLFLGLTGLGYATHLCSDHETRYQRMLANIENLLIREVDHVFLRKVDAYVHPEAYIPSDLYNIANGLGGVIAYLLHRNRPLYHDFTYQCIHALVRLLSNKKKVGRQEVPAWYCLPDIEQFSEDEKYQRGHYTLNFSYGLTGVMSVLSMAAIKGINVEGLSSLISKMTDWIKSQHILNEQVVFWEQLIPLEDSLKTPPRTQKRGTLGNLFIGRSLYLASTALSDRSLSEFAEKAFISHLTSQPELDEQLDASYSNGMAGILSLTHQMGCETQKDIFFQTAKEMERHLINRYHPNHEFGFQCLSFRTDHPPQWIDNPGLFNGAAGIGITLLSLHGQYDMRRENYFSFIAPFR